MKTILARSIGAGWLDASEWLSEQDWEEFNLVLEIDLRADPEVDDRAISQRLDTFLQDKGLQRTDTVANTIFPQFYYQSVGYPQFFDAFDRDWPRMRRLCSKNRNGHYFRRMTHLEMTDRRGRPTVLNPLEEITRKISTEAARERTKRCAYPLAVYQPARDATRLVGGMGFPCLTTVDFKIEKPFLHLNAMYRNQRYIERAYGNLLGLSNLLRFVAGEAGLNVGLLTCWATHAELETQYGKRAVGDLLQDCRRLATGSSTEVGGASSARETQVSSAA